MTNVNPNTHSPHGADPSVSDATGSVAIAEAEKAAPGSTNMEKEDKTPRTEMTNSENHIAQGVDALLSDVASPVVNPAGEDAFQPQATKDDTHRTGESVVEFIWYSSRKYRECSLTPLLDLERAELVVDVWESCHGGDHSLSLYKVWFDFANHKVVDVQKIKWFRLKTATYGLDAQPPDDLPENTFEFCPIENKDAFANMQKAFDSSDLQDFLKACELRFRFPTTAPYPRSFMMVEKTSDVASAVVNPAGEDAFQPQAKTNAAAKVGRNEPCPCGSGKKYKKCCSLSGLVAASPGTSDRNEITIGMAPKPLKHQPRKVGNTDEREFKQLGETLAENIEFYLSPEGNVEVAGYGIINHTTQTMSVVPSISIHVKDMTDRLHAGGWLNEGDLIDQFSFMYDLSNLTILCLRRYVGSPDWIEERDPTAIAEIENELADNCAESWRELYPEALRRKLNMKAQQAPQAGRVYTSPAFLPTQVG